MKKFLNKFLSFGIIMMLCMLCCSIIASAASLSENFDSYNSTDDMSLNWISDGSFVSDLTLSKNGGVKGSKALKAEYIIDKSLEKHWGIIRAIYPEMSDTTATGFHLWAKCDKANIKMNVQMRYNNMTWKYGKEIVLTKEGKYYDIPFSEMKLTQGRVTTKPEDAQDPNLIGEWQFEVVNDWSQPEIAVYLDELSYIHPGSSNQSSTQQGTTAKSSNPTSATTSTKQTDSNGSVISSVPDETSSEIQSETESSIDEDNTSLNSSETDNSSSKTDVKTKTKSKKLGKGAVIAIVAGGVVILAALGYGIYYFIKKKRA